jgi:hypothetical protein
MDRVGICPKWIRRKQAIVLVWEDISNGVVSPEPHAQAVQRTPWAGITDGQGSELRVLHMSWSFQFKLDLPTIFRQPERLANGYRISAKASLRACGARTLESSETRPHECNQQ